MSYGLMDSLSDGLMDLQRDALATTVPVSRHSQDDSHLLTSRATIARVFAQTSCFNVATCTIRHRDAFELPGRAKQISDSG
jgi:hypothetical protein